MRKDMVLGAAIGAGLVILVGVVGYEVGYMRALQPAHTVVDAGNAAPGSTSQPTSTWKGLSQANPQMESALRGATVEAPNGKTVPFPTDKPVLVFAPWCKYCHETLQLLQKEGLLDKFTLVAAGLAYQEGRQPSTSQTPMTLDQAKQKVQQSFDSLGIHKTAGDVLYAMPGTAADKAIPGYPEVLIPHGGHWYVQPGYVADPKFWHNLLDA